MTNNLHLSTAKQFRALSDAVSEVSIVFTNLGIQIQEGLVPILKEFSDSPLWIELRRVKMDSETWDEYIARVPDGLDNPDVRWEYQKFILSTPIRLVKRFTS